jgi:hypothetical protein
LDYAVCVTKIQLVSCAPAARGDDAGRDCSMVDQEIEGQLSRARELRRELEAECEPGKLAAAEMQPRALTLFVEVLEKLRAILDRAGFFIIAPFLSLVPASMNGSAIR